MPRMIPVDGARNAPNQSPNPLTASYRGEDSSESASLTHGPTTRRVEKIRKGGIEIRRDRALTPVFPGRRALGMAGRCLIACSRRSLDLSHHHNALRNLTQSG